jgi:hypothetical protein
LGSLLTVLVASCRAPAAEQANPIDLGTFERLFQVDAHIVLEERPPVVTVAPMVRSGSDGSFIIADARESQIRAYDRSGALLQYVGNFGDGPGEFRRPVSARVLPNGEALAVDLAAQTLTFLQSESLAFQRRTRLPHFPLLDALPLPEDRLLIVGRHGAPGYAHWLHIWDLKKERQLRSFLPTPSVGTYQQLDASIGFVAAAVRGDTIAAIYALTDTLFLYTATGTEIERIPFGPLSLPRMSLSSQRTYRGNLLQLVGRVRRYVDLYWLDDGSFVVQHYLNRGLDKEWGLLQVSRQGSIIGDYPRMPRLLLILDRTYLFDDPAAGIPNRWILARTRS